MIINAIWEHFSVECHKTKVNGQSEESKYLKGLMRIQSKNNETAKVRENAADQVVIGFIIASDWLMEWNDYRGK